MSLFVATEPRQWASTVRLNAVPSSWWGFFGRWKPFGVEKLGRAWVFDLFSDLPRVFYPTNRWPEDHAWKEASSLWQVIYELCGGLQALKRHLEWLLAIKGVGPAGEKHLRLCYFQRKEVRIEPRLLHFLLENNMKQLVLDGDIYPSLVAGALRFDLTAWLSGSLPWNPTRRPDLCRGGQNGYWKCQLAVRFYPSHVLLSRLYEHSSFVPTKRTDVVIQIPWSPRVFTLMDFLFSLGLRNPSFIAVGHRIYTVRMA